jgi:hypothetical protein
MKRTIEVRKTLAVLGVDEPTRQEIMARFKMAGGSLDRWARFDLLVMGDAITRTEDRMEHASHARSTPSRRRLRQLRRELEGALGALGS